MGSITPTRTMAANDEEVPKLDSLPPEGEGDEVTRVGSRDEIQRALENEAKDLLRGPPRAANNIPTPPVPPPTAEVKQALAADEPRVGIRLAPPPADLAGGRQNETPTKPPTAGAVSDLDVDAAFTDELDENLLEPAPPSMRSAAPPLPPAALRATSPPGQRPSRIPTPIAEPSPLVQASGAPPRTVVPSDAPAPLVPRESQSPGTRPHTALVMLFVVGAVVAAFFLAALLSRR